MENIKEAVCVICKKLRINDEWSVKKAAEKDYKTLGRVICPDCRPKTEG